MSVVPHNELRTRHSDVLPRIDGKLEITVEHVFIPRVALVASHIIPVPAQEILIVRHFQSHRLGAEYLAVALIAHDIRGIAARQIETMASLHGHAYVVHEFERAARLLHFPHY